ncbi:microfibril-associated glycoprotein 4-like [Saccostrea cucullata]|uniref:microfibril-associated glycoprotein 4-like n=1 Tax=Saccostrea cuccullata TaxID=36930 RepID=UPI002ED6B5C1
MKKEEIIFLLYLFISALFGNVYSLGNDQQEKQLLRSPTSGKTSSILRDIFKKESSLRFSMVQKIQNLVTNAIDNNNITEILRDKLVSLENKVNSIQNIQSENQKQDETLNESLDDFREDQNATRLQLQNVLPVPQSDIHCFLPLDCFDIYNCGERENGVYNIYPFKTRVSTKVLCDMDTDGGGWTVIQRRNREMPRVNFNTTWNEYRQGFGDVPGNYWLGNDAIHKLTTEYNNSLYIRFESTKKNSYKVQYSLFSISNETDGYRLSLGQKSGNIVDQFRVHFVVNYPFSTFDNDRYTCAARSGSGWWYNHCTLVNLNAPFAGGHSNYVWSGIISQGSDLSFSEMLIKRKH